jgi:hypothetical protein
MATAMTPVVVALVREALERPAQRVSSIATRSAAPPVARAARVLVPPPPEIKAPPPEAQAPPPPMTVDPSLTAMRVYGRDRKVGRRWKLAIATGLLGFVVCVAVLTVPELVAGRSVVSARHDTTIFGGRRHAPAATATPDKTRTDEKTTTEVVPEDQSTTHQSTATTTAPAQPTQPAPQSQQPSPQTQTAPSQTQPQPAVPQQQPAPTTP